MKYKRMKSLRKYCAMMSIAALMFMSACAGTQAVNGAWWDVCHDTALQLDCSSTAGGDSNGNGSGCTG